MFANESQLNGCCEQVGWIDDLKLWTALRYGYVYAFTCKHASVYVGMHKNLSVQVSPLHQISAKSQRISNISFFDTSLSNV